MSAAPARVHGWHRTSSRASLRVAPDPLPREVPSEGQNGVRIRTNADRLAAQGIESFRKSRRALFSELGTTLTFGAAARQGSTPKNRVRIRTRFSSCERALRAKFGAKVLSERHWNSNSMFRPRGGCADALVRNPRCLPPSSLGQCGSKSMVNRRGRRSAAAALVSSFVAISCAQSLPPVTVLEQDSNSHGVDMGKPLFACNYDRSWGDDVAFGHVLDDRGRIWFYNRGRTTASPEPEPAGDGLFLESGLRARFRNPVLQSLRVSPARLAQMSQKAELARAGRIERGRGAPDLGASGCEAYLWARADAYQRIELGTGGDFWVQNSLPEASELKAYLQVELGMGQRPKSWRK